VKTFTEHPLNVKLGGRAGAPEFTKCTGGRVGQ